MSFQCPKCLCPKTLKITQMIELPPDSRSDEITLQIIKCTNCNFEGLAVYEESRRGGLGNGSFSHVGYFVKIETISLLKQYIRKCPDPKDPHCRCDNHQTLGSKDQSGRWNGLSEFDIGKVFNLHISNRNQ